MAKYKVTLTKVANIIEVEAASKSEAKELAKSKVNYSVWESVVDEVID